MQLAISPRQARTHSMVISSEVEGLKIQEQSKLPEKPKVVSCMQNINSTNYPEQQQRDKEVQIIKHNKVLSRSHKD